MPPTNLKKAEVDKASSSSNAAALEKVPKAVVNARLKLANSPANFINLKEALGNKDMNAYQNNFRNSLTPERKKEFAELPKEDKQNWMVQWLLDPAMCSKIGYNRTEAFSESLKRGEVAWVTREVLAGPGYMNSLQHADWIIEGQELEERDHKSATLAAKGVKEYKVTKEWLEQNSGTRSVAGVEATADVTTDQYDEVKASMENDALSRTPLKKKKS